MYYQVVKMSSHFPLLPEPKTLKTTRRRSFISSSWSPKRFTIENEFVHLYHHQKFSFVSQSWTSNILRHGSKVWHRLEEDAKWINLFLKMNRLGARVTWDSKWKHPHFYLSGSYHLVIDRVQMNLAYWYSVNYCSFHFGFLLFYLNEKLAVVVASKSYSTNAVIIYHHLVILHEHYYRSIDRYA